MINDLFNTILLFFGAFLFAGGIHWLIFNLRAFAGDVVTIVLLALLLFAMCFYLVTTA